MLALARRTLGWFSTRARKGLLRSVRCVSFSWRQVISTAFKSAARLGWPLRATLPRRRASSALSRRMPAASPPFPMLTPIISQPRRRRRDLFATVGADFVQIMTVHASKGLEFAQRRYRRLGKGVSSAPSLIAENIGDNTFASARHKPADAAGKVADKLRSFVFEEGEGAIAPGASTPGALHEELEERVAAQTLAEAQRLLYVALTRAGKSLVLSYVTRSGPSSPTRGTGSTATLTARCVGLCDNDECRSLCEYGGQRACACGFSLSEIVCGRRGRCRCPRCRRRAFA